MLAKYENPLNYFTLLRSIIEKKAIILIQKLMTFIKISIR